MPGCAARRRLLRRGLLLGRPLLLRVDLAERDHAGIYNAAGPTTPVNWEQVLQELAKQSSQPVRVRWSTTEVLQKTGIRLPLTWLSEPAQPVVRDAMHRAGIV